MAIKKLPIKKLVEFRRLTKRSQLTFSNRLKFPKENDSGGGDYWVRSISAISNAFKENNNSFVQAKLEETVELYNLNQRTQTKIMYKRNIDILEKYQDFNFETWRPTADLTFFKKPNSTVEMNTLPLQIRPNHVFSYGDDNNKSVGGIWFIAWLDGFKTEDLGIYSEALFRYLSSFYSENYIINPASCMIVDVSRVNMISYNQVLNGEIPSLLDSTIDSLKRLL